MTRPRILIADDHVQVAAHVRILLGPEFVVLGCVSNGGSLIDEALRLRPDGLVVDISMPVLNGIAAVRRLRDLHSAAKVVFLSQHLDPTYVEAAMHAGGDGYVVKQSAAAELRAALHAVLGGQAFISSCLAMQAQLQRIALRR